MDKPLISVCMITYNHESYIAEAIEGVLSQLATFNIELIISNDASKDGTHNIISKLLINTSNISIRYFNHQENLGMIPNFIDSLKKCTGKYIALCEGDDYWTDPLKLQKQVDFLEGHPEYNICFHNVVIYNQELKEVGPDNITRQVNETTNVTDLVRGNYIHTPSVVLRNNFKIPNWYRDVYIGDWSLYMLMVKDKKIKKLKETMAVYRVSNAGVWSTKSKEYKRNKSLATVQLVYKNAELSIKAKEILSYKIQGKKKLPNLKSRIKNKIKYLIKNLFR